MGGQYLVSSRSAVAQSFSSGTTLSPCSAVAQRCLCERTLSLSSGVALCGEHNYYIFKYPHFMRNYFRNYLEEIRFKIGGFGVWGNALRILREQAFLVAHSLLPNLLAIFQPNSVACFLPKFYECTLHPKLGACCLPKFYECSLHPTHHCPRPPLTKSMKMFPEV